MKILLSSYVFSPSVGGIETVSALIAPEFVKAGHEVVLVTRTRHDDGIAWPFQVERHPSPLRLLNLVRWCDVYFQNNISLHLAWPLLLVPRPWVIAHHTWLGRFQNERNWRGELKRRLLRHGLNATISRPVADDLPVPSTIVGNPYSNEVFKLEPEIARNRELVYLGRLVPDKGVDMLIEALVDLRARGLYPRLTIIGSGPEEQPLRKLAGERGVADQITFTGSKEPGAISQLLNGHQILVIPSRWPEPFGIVALEGIACGCVVVAADSGGLPDAVGPCGITFPLNDQAALNACLLDELTQPELRERFRANAAAHLQQFEPAIVAENYLKVFHRALAARSAPCE